MNAFLQILGWALIHALWQVCVLVLLAALFGLFLRGPLRHRMNGTVLLLCLLLPAATAWRLHRPEPAGTVAVLGVALPPGVPAAAPGAPGIRSLPLLTRLEGAVQPHLPLLVALWSLGVAAMALRLGGGYAVCLRWKRQASKAPAECQNRLEDLARRMGLTRRVRLLLTKRGDTPMALGLWKPAVLVPAALLTALPPAYLEALLAHELAHVRRLDHLGNLLQGLAETLLFFHPALWWLSSRIRLEREELADDLAARSLGDPRRLALALDALDDVQSTFPPSPFPALAARGGPLLTRIERLMSPPKPALSPHWGLFTLLLLPCAVLSLRAAVPDPPPIPAPAELVAQLDALAVREGLDPQLLRSMAWVESGFNARAKSPMGAMGLLQVMPETARKFGAKNFDDSAEVMAAGAKYLRFLLDRYQGNVNKAVAAYNCGEKTMDEGRVTPEAAHYQTLVMEVLGAKAVQPATPLGEGEVSGVFRRSGNGKVWTSDNHVNASGGFTLEFLPAPGQMNGQAPPAYGTVMVGAKPTGTPGEWLTFQPKVTLEIPEGTALLLRCTDLGTGRVGECPITLSGRWQSFRFRMEKPKG